MLALSGDKTSAIPASVGKWINDVSSLALSSVVIPIVIIIILPKSTHRTVFTTTKRNIATERSSSGKQDKENEEKLEKLMKSFSILSSSRCRWLACV